MLLFQITTLQSYVVISNNKKILFSVTMSQRASDAMARTTEKKELRRWRAVPLPKSEPLPHSKVVTPEEVVKVEDKVYNHFNDAAVSTQIYKSYAEQFDERVLTNCILADPGVQQTLAMGELQRNRERARFNATKKRFTVPFQLTSKQQAVLQDNYLEYDLVFDHAMYNNPHGFAAADRMLAAHRMEDMVHLTPHTEPRKGYDFSVKFVGGNPEHTIKGEYVHAHTCAPVLDLLDAARNARFQQNLAMGIYHRTRSLRKNIILRDYLDPKGTRLCHSKSQYCPATAPVLIALHSAYDMTLKDIGAMMDEAKAEVMLCALIFHPIIFLQTSGVIPDQEMSFVRFRRNGRVYIRFYFKDDTQHHYIHDFEVYTALFRKMSFSTANGAFTINVDHYRNGSAIVRIDRTRCQFIPKTLACRSYPLEDDYYILYVSVLIDHRSERKSLKRVRLVVPKQLWNDGYAWAITTKDPRFTERNIAIALQAINSRAVNQGVGFRRDLLMEPSQIRYVALALYIVVYIENYQISQTEKLMKGQIEKERQKKSVLERLCAAMTDSRRRFVKRPHGHQSAIDTTTVDAIDQIVAKAIKDEGESCSRDHSLADLESLSEDLPILRLMPAVLTVNEEIEATFSQEPLTELLYEADIRETIPAEDSDTELQMRLRQCSGEFEEVQVSGDGDCMIHALRAAGAAIPEPSRVRAMLLESDSCTPEVARALKAPKGTTESWLDVSHLALICKEFGISVCLHSAYTPDGSCQWFGSFEPNHHISYSMSHYNALRPVYPLESCIDIDLRAECEQVQAPDYEAREKAFPSLSPAQSDEVKKVVDRYSTVSRGTFVARSGLKLAELFYRLHLPTNQRFALDLGGGPGSFVQFLLHRTEAHVFGITKRRATDGDSDYPYHASLFNSSRFSMLLSDGRCDLTDDDSFAAVVETVDNLKDTVELVTADASVGYDGTPDVVAKKVTVNNLLMEREWALAKTALTDGGIFILKMADVANSQPKRLLQDLSVHFSDLRLVKPHTSRPHIREVYLVAQGFSRDPVYVALKEDAIFAAASQVLKREMQHIKLIRPILLSLQTKAPINLAAPVAKIANYQKVLALTEKLSTGGAINDCPVVPDYAIGDLLRKAQQISDEESEITFGAEDDLDTVCSHLSSADHESFVTAPSPVEEPKKSRNPAQTAGKFFMKKLVKTSKKLEDVITRGVREARKKKALRDAIRTHEVLGVPTPSIPAPAPLTIERPVSDLSERKTSEGLQLPEEDPERLRELEAQERIAAIDRDYMRDRQLEQMKAMYDEYVAYLDYLFTSHQSNHNKLFVRLMNASDESRAHILKGHAADGYQLLTAKRAAAAGYRYACDGKKIDLIQKFHESSTVLVSNALKLLVDADIRRYLLDHPVQIHRTFDVDFIQAAPGCGKTRELVERFDGSHDTLILTSTTEGRDDVRAKLERRHGDVPEEVVRTIHSVLANGTPQKRKLMIDEALMQHPGMIIAALNMANPAHTTIVGDIKQIPFVNRTPDFRMVGYSLTSLFRVTKVLNISYRCPTDVAARLFKTYHPDGMYSTSYSESSMKLVHIASPTEVEYHKGRQYLTFTQAEKSLVIQKGVAVSTVHEYQGKQADHIVVVRLVPANHNVEIFESHAYALVAATRHTKSLVYYSMSRTDALAKLISAEPTRDQLKHVFVQPGGYLPDHTVRRLAFTVEAVTPVSASSLRVVNEVPKGHQRLDLSPYRNLRQLKDFVSSVKNFGSYAIILPKDRDPTPYIGCVATTSLDAVVVRGEHTIIHPNVADLLNFNAIVDTPFTRVSFEQVACPEAIREDITIEPDVSYLQYVANTLFPNSVFVDNSLDSYRVAVAPIRFNLPGVSLVPHQGLYKPPEFDTLAPVLQTHAPRIRESNTNEILLAIQKRNAAVPQLQTTCDVVLIANRMMERLKGFFVNRTAYEEIQINATMISEWLAGQSQGTEDAIEPSLLEKTDMASYEFIIKRSPKPALTDAAGWDYQALQTVLFHPKNVNAIFCPVIREVKRRLKEVLKPHVKIYSDVSPDEFAEELTLHIPPASITGQQFFEMDISKYDKSQGFLTLEFEMLFFRHFGVPERLINLWYYAHVHSKFFERLTGVKGKISFQRRSGDASTFLGNTAFLLAVIADSVDVSTISMCLAAGDDSLVVGHGVRDQISPDRLARLYNLEAKILRNESMYFCSKFLLVDLDRYYFVPDPVKLLIKLGRHDLRNWQHAEEYRLSVADTVSYYKVESLVALLTAALIDRYPFPFSPESFIRMMAGIAEPEAFSQLYYEPPGACLLNDPNVVLYD
nr:TPA_asm: hypothetical protein [Fasciogiga virus]